MTLRSQRQVARTGRRADSMTQVPGPAATTPSSLSSAIRAVSCCTCRRGCSPKSSTGTRSHRRSCERAIGIEAARPPRTAGSLRPPEAIQFLCFQAAMSPIKTGRILVPGVFECVRSPPSFARRGPRRSDGRFAACAPDVDSAPSHSYQAEKDRRGLRNARLSGHQRVEPCGSRRVLKFE